MPSSSSSNLIITIVFLNCLSLVPCNFVFGKENEICDLDDFELLNLLSQVSGMEIPESLDRLKNSEKRFESVVKKDEMINAVLDFLKI